MLAKIFENIKRRNKAKDVITEKKFFVSNRCERFLDPWKDQCLRCGECGREFNKYGAVTKEV